MDWGAVGAGSAAVGIVGGFLGWICKMSVEAAVAKAIGPLASKKFVEEKIRVHEEIYHQEKK